MQNTSRSRRQRLLRTADSQQGYFTSKQAIEAGYSDSVHSYHVRSGNWMRVLRGIYRLSDYPDSEEEQQVLYSLWSIDRSGVAQGTYSYETALAIHELSDIMPDKLHMTVPPGFRRVRIPEGLVLHQGEVPRADRARRRGFEVTTPRRTLSDLLRSPHISHEQLAMALRQAYERGLILDADIERWHQSTEIDQKLLKALLQEAQIV